MLSRISIPIMYLCRSLHTGSVADGSRSSDGPVAVVLFLLLIILLLFLLLLLIRHLLLPLSLLLSLLCRFYGCLRSYNYCIDPNVWSVLFQTFSICEFININNHPASRNSTHPPVFIAPRILVYRKMGVFIPKLALFTDFRPFFARSSVKYQPISQMVFILG